MSGLFNMCVKATLRDWEIPFRVGGAKPSKRLMEALKESEDIINNPEKHKGYTNLDEMWEDLEK